MERVLEELKRIEEEAEKIRLEASEKAEEIIKAARQKAKVLVTDAEKEAERTVERLLERFREDMKERHRRALKKSEVVIDEIRRSASRNMDSAVDLVFRTLVGEKRE